MRALAAALSRRVVALPRLGRIGLIASATALHSVSFLDWDDVESPTAADARGPHRILDRAEAALRAYADGKGLATVPVDLAHHGEFTRAVLEATARIPAGATATYGEIAYRIGKPGAARAVGQALGRNTAPIFIPCHRVLAANGIGGFTPGTDIKEILLTLDAPNAVVARQR